MLRMIRLIVPFKGLAALNMLFNLIQILAGLFSLALLMPLLDFMFNNNKDAFRQKSTGGSDFNSLYSDFIQWMTEDHPSKDGKAVGQIEKIVIADKEKLSDSWFKTEILNGLDSVSIDWIDPSTQDGETGIVSVHLSTPSGSVVLD